MIRRHIAMAVAAGALLGSDRASAQTVTYTTQTGNFNALQTERNTNPPYAGTYNNGATELAQYANGGSFGNTPGAAAFQTFTTTGNGTTGSIRPLQVGDAFTITAFTSANPSAGGYLGISFRDSTSFTNVFAATDSASEARFQLDSTGGWKVYNAGSAVDSGLGANSDRTFTLTVTSGSTFNASVGGATSYNLGMAASGGTIDSLAIYTFGDANQNSFWKNATLTATGTVQLGYAAANGTTFVPGLVSDGLLAGSTSTVRPNAVFIGGDAGSQVNLTQANTYSGATTINANAAAEAQNASALGTTDAGTTVASGGVLKLYSPTGMAFATEPLTLNGVGVSSLNGALRSVGGSNTWNGPITLASSSRINADASGGAGSLTITGSVAAGSNVLFLGASGAAVSISGAISGGGASQDGTITSVFKDGAGTLTLSGANTYTGDTRVTSGTLTVASGGSLGNGSDVFISSGAVVALGTSVSVASVQETGVGNGGSMTIGAGSVLTVTGSGFSGFQNSIGGLGGLAIVGAGTTTLYGTQSYTGLTTVSAGRLAAGVPVATSSVAVTGGQFAATAADILGDGVVVTLSGGGVYSVGGSDTIGGLVGTGGTVSLGTSRLTVVQAGSGTFSGAVTGSGTLATSGAGLLVLAGNSPTFTGLTQAGSGTLALTGTLGGGMSASGSSVIAGRGLLGGNLSMAAGAALRFDPLGPLTVTGTTSFGGFGVANLLGLDQYTPDGTYTLISGSVNLAGVSNVGPGNAAALGGTKTAYFEGVGLRLVVVPEPTTTASLIASLAMLGVVRRRSR
ncbi:MAG: beta strand repeat-containing protein [Planctomycetaceae bacterium]